MNTKFKIGERELIFDGDTKEIRFEDRVLKPSIRTFGDMKSLYKDDKSDGEKIQDDEGLYFMYRDISFNESDKNTLKENGIRYDITVIVPKLIGKEYNKTFGHFHPKNKKGKTYKEIYQVLSGQAMYLQQNKEKAFYTLAFAGDSVLMEEGFGHVTINNSTDEVLIMVNLVDDNFESIYSDYREKEGANHFYTTEGFELNPRYNNEMKIDRNTELVNLGCIYEDFIEEPEAFNFLH